MNAGIENATVKGLTYRAGTKETDPAAIGRAVIEFDADDADAGEIAALIGQRITVSLTTPQLAMVGIRTASITSEPTEHAATRSGADA